jgi:homoserine O-acetyltransferase
MKFFDHQADFTLENGTVLPGIRIAYDTYGELNADKSNVPYGCAMH